MSLMQPLMADTLRFNSSYSDQSLADSSPAGVSFYSNGQVTQYHSFPSIPQWVYPSYASQQKTYYIRASNLTGSTTFYSGPALNTWHALTTTRTWSLTPSTNELTFSYSFDCQIAEDSSGSSIVSTGSVTLTVEASGGAL